ncbi:glycosyltransferase family protein [Rhodoligotrophos ferricapiens]|uniref:glycosyltransferase family protein n=1 Tax=Rhodoligotrophos ferricapiens TaxID=3069264 RepID=UPI00315D19AA
MKAEERPILIWVTHVLGIGHYQRAMVLAGALAQAGLRPVVASGGVPVPAPVPKGVVLKQLPAIRSGDNGYTNLIDEAGREAGEDLFRRRAEALLNLYRVLRPAMIITELYPFGRRRFADELDGLLVLATAEGRDLRPKIVCSVRDILQPPSNAQKIASVRRLIADYDAILVHGDPNLVPVERSLPLVAEFADRIRYTGYMRAGRSRQSGGKDGLNEVIVSAGGGAVGRELLVAAAAARSLSAAAGLTWRFLIGHNMPAGELAAIKGANDPGVIVEPARPDFPELLKRARLSISQAGYNTCVDILQARVPAVLVPYRGPAGGEIEQPLRAKILEEKGLAFAVDPGELTPLRLARAIDDALMLNVLSTPRPSLDGARRSAAIIKQMLVEPVT